MLAQAWSERSGLHFFNTKIKAFFKGTFHRWRRPRVFMADERIFVVPQVKYLRHVIDEGNRFKSQINDVIANVKLLCVKRTTLAKTSDGYDCRSLRLLYTGLTQQLLTYGCKI